MAKDMYLKYWNSTTSEWDLVSPYTKVELVEGLSALLDSKVNKVDGMGLSEESYTTVEKTKLAGIEEAANAYVHSETHAPAIIVQDENNRFVTDIQITAWDAKEDKSNEGIANGYASLDGFGKIPKAQLPIEAQITTHVVYDSTERDALDIPSLFTGDKCYETATGDSYIWNGSGWSVLAQADWENVNLLWTNIVDKPTSSIVNIDDAVTKRHEHSNKTLLDKFMESEVNASYDLAAFLTSISWEDILSKPTEFPVAAHTHDPVDILTDANNRFATDVEKTEWQIKTKFVLAFDAPTGGAATGNTEVWFEDLTESGILSVDIPTDDPEDYDKVQWKYELEA